MIKLQLRLKPIIKRQNMITINNSLITGIDIQQKLVKMLDCGLDIQNNSAKLLKAASILNIKTLLTEQYPKGLGETVDEIKKIAPFKTIEKTTFSACQTKEFQDEINNLDKNIKNIIIFGIETHICVYQTALDLLKSGFSVYVVCDCTSSRKELNKNTALELMKQQGIKVTTLEILLFEFLKSSKHEHFKEIQALIK